MLKAALAIGLLIAGISTGHADQWWRESYGPAPSAGELGQPQQDKTTRPQEAPSTERRGSEQSPLIVKMVSPPDDPAKTAQEAEDRKEKSAEDRSLVSYSLALDILTTVLVGVGILQLGVFGYQAVQLTRTVNAMQATEKRQLRAYVSAIPDFFYAFNVGERTHIKFTINNTGTTPAFNARHRAKIIIAPEPLPDGFNFPEIEDAFSAPAVGFPQSPYFGNRLEEQPFSNAEIVMVRAGTSRFYIYGEVVYDDIFDIERTTKFCSSVVATSKVWVKLTTGYKPTDLEVIFQLAPVGNTAT